MSIHIYQELKSKSYFYWLPMGLIFVLVQSAVIGLWPLILQDGIQILDAGRASLSPQTAWSMAWIVESNFSSMTSFYVGPALQELAYQVLAPTILGPRFSSLAGALIASAFFAMFLLLRKVPKVAALSVSFIFLCDPIFHESYSQGRVDSWAFASIFVACILIRKSASNSVQESRRKLFLALAGVISAVAPFVWVTSLALYPLVLLESFASFGRFDNRAKDKLKSVFFSGIWIASGWLAAFLVLIIPVLFTWEQQVQSFQMNVEIQSVAAVVKRPILGMYVLYDPFILLPLFLALFARKNIWIIISMALALLMMLQTMIYPMRILYLLPYIALIIATALAEWSENANARRRNGLLILLTGILLSWNFYVCMIQRPVEAIGNSAQRDPHQIEFTLNEVIGEGPYRVFSTEWEPYFAARKLGWKVFNLVAPTYESREQYLQFLRGMDYAIFRDKMVFMKNLNLKLLEDAGFELVETVRFSHGDESGPEFISAYEPVMVFKNMNRETPD